MPLENASAALKKTIGACKVKGKAVLLLPRGCINIWQEGVVKRELYFSNSIEDDTLGFTGK